MQRGTPSGTATSAAPSRGTSLQPSRRAARAGYSAVRSGDDVKIALSTSSGWKPLVSWSARNSSAVASRIAWPVLAGAVVAPRSPRRVLLMALAGQLRLMVITDAGVLKGRDPVEACRRAVAGGATMIQVRLKDAPPEEVVALARALVGALAVPVIVNDRVDVALAAGAAGAHLGQEDPPLDRLRSHVPPRFLLGLSVGSPAQAERGRAWPADYWSVGPCFATANKPDAGAPLGAEGFGRLARLAPAGTPVIGIGGVTPANAPPLAPAAAAGPVPWLQRVVLRGEEDRVIGGVPHLRLDNRGGGEGLVSREVQGVGAPLPLRAPLLGELVRHDADQLPRPDPEREQVGRREQVSLGAGRLGGNADAHEQARVLGCREEGIPRNLELGPGEVRHLGEPQALPHGEALLDPPAALERRHHVGPRFVLPQQVHAALERACQPAQPGIQPERAGMGDHVVGGERVDGGVIAHPGTFRLYARLRGLA